MWATCWDGMDVRMRCEDGGEKSKGLRDYELFLSG